MTATTICTLLAIIAIVIYIVLMLYFFNNKKDFAIMSISATITLFIVLGSIYIFNPDLKNNRIKKILAENNYEFSSLEIVSTVDLKDNIDGLSGKNKFVLLSSDDSGTRKFAPCVVNEDKRKVTSPVFAYKPLNIIMSAIFDSGQQLNIKNFDRMRAYIEKFGFDCFEKQEYAESYIRDITGSNGFYSTDTARQAIINSISYISPDILSANDFTVLFENDNANPMYYAIEDTEMVYNWNMGVLGDESVYNVWKANTDRRTQETMAALYGSPYSLEPVWTAFDKNLNKVGTYSSKEEMERVLKPKKSTNKKNNTSLEDVEKKSSKEKKAKTGESSTANTDKTITAKHILVQSYDTAKNLLTRIKNGEDFDVLMNKYTEDPGTAKNPNGYTFERGEMVKEFEDASYALNIGEISDIVKSTYGYHIIKRVQ